MKEKSISSDEDCGETLREGWVVFEGSFTALDEAPGEDESGALSHADDDDATHGPDRDVATSGRGLQSPGTRLWVWARTSAISRSLRREARLSSD